MTLSPSTENRRPGTEDPAGACHSEGLKEMFPASIQRLPGNTALVEPH